MMNVTVGNAGTISNTTNAANAEIELRLIIAGLGGQGVVFLTRLLSETAASLDYPVMVSETHGMSQRGGSVISHLKVGGNQAALIGRGTADALLALASTAVEASRDGTPAAQQNNARPCSHVRRDNFGVDIVTSERIPGARRLEATAAS